MAHAQLSNPVAALVARHQPMTSKVWTSAVALAALAALQACGGEGGSNNAPPVTVTPTPAPTPSPTPTPTPPPPVFTAVTGQLFSDNQNLVNLEIRGRGWLADYIPNASQPPSNIRDGGTITASYEIASNSYRLAVPLLGDGTLYQTGANRSQIEGFGEVYPATLAASLAAAQSSPQADALLILKARSPQNLFMDVAFVSWYSDEAAGGNLRTGSVGVAGIARPAPLSAVATIGARRYAISSLANIAGNFGDFVIGSGEINISPAGGAVDGTINLSLACFMGCSYPAAPMQLVSPVISPSSRNFTGLLTVPGAASQGVYEGVFAGPNAEEILIGFEAPYLDPDRQTWTMIRGILIGRTI